MNRSILAIAVVLLTLMSCGETPSTDSLITVDVTADYPEKEFALQDLFDVEYVPLETTDEFVTMGYLQDINDKYIVVRNRNMNSDGEIFFFDHKGKGVKKINRQGPGPEEYQFLLSVILDDEELFVIDRNTKSIAVYDQQGNFKRKFKMMCDGIFDKVYPLGKDFYICHDYLVKETIKNTFLLISKQDGSIVKELSTPYNVYVSPRVVDTEKRLTTYPRNEPLVSYNSGWLLMDNSSDTIYHCQTDNLKPLVARTPAVGTMDKVVFLYPGLFTEQYYFMQSVKKEYVFGRDNDFPRTDLVYDRAEKAMFQAHVYNTDDTEKENISLSHGLMVVNRDGIAFVKTLEAIDLVEANEHGKLQGKLKAIADKLKEDDNPVLLIAKYKK